MARRTIHCSLENPLVLGGTVQENLDAFKRLGSKLPFEGTGIQVKENQNLVPPEQQERNPEVLAMIEKKAKKVRVEKPKAAKASIVKPKAPVKTKIKPNGVIKKVTKAAKKAVKEISKSKK